MSYRQEFQISDFLKLMQDKECQAWLKGRQIIEKRLSESAQLSLRFKQQIKKNLRRVNNFLMLIYIYSLNLQYLYASYEYRSQLDSFRDQNSYSLILSWLEQQNQQKQQLTVQLILQSFTQLLSKKIFSMNMSQLCLLLQSFSLFDIKRQRNISILMNFVTNVREIRLLQTNQMLTKQIAILRLICSISADDKKSKGNMGLLFDQSLLGELDDKNIDKFCNYYDIFICDFTPQQMLNLVRAICKSGLNYLIVTLIFKISKVLASSQEYFKLKYLFQKFILPYLVKYGKSCKKQKVSFTILTIADLYIVGFLDHCDIGQVGIDYSITRQIERKRWIQLAYMAAIKAKKQKLVDHFLTKNKLDKYVVEGKAGRDNLNKNESWQITARNIRQHKVYKSEDSTYWGIKNHSVQCYIISSVQALFMTKNLQDLFKKASRKRNRAIDALSNVFEALSSQKKRSIKIDEVQQKGPQQFAKSERQQDAYQYLIALMDQMQKQLKQQKLLSQFKQIFEIEQISTVVCQKQKCKHSKISTQNTYIHTISNNQTIKFEGEEQLTDFSCEKCKDNKCKKLLQLKVNSKIFIVHINRFSVSKGVARKQLPTSKIIRRINNYSLVGIVFHIGKSVQCGHYVYYSKLDSKRWVQFNDQNVKEFSLDREDQEFERQTKAEKTPYILFYKRQK